MALGLYEISAKFRVAEKKIRPKLGRTNRPPKFLYEPWICRWRHLKWTNQFRQKEIHRWSAKVARSTPKISQTFQMAGGSAHNGLNFARSFRKEYCRSIWARSTDLGNMTTNLDWSGRIWDLKVPPPANSRLKQKFWRSIYAVKFWPNFFFRHKKFRWNFVWPQRHLNVPV